MQWLISLLGGGIFKAFGDTIVQPILTAYLKSKDIDVEKFKAASASTEQMAVAIVDANVKFATIKSGYALSVLQWWPFRLILFVVLAICATRFSLIMIDATLPRILGYPEWSIDPLKGNYGSAELEYILFFVIAKPVDTAISGALGLASRYLAR